MIRLWLIVNVTEDTKVAAVVDALVEVVNVVVPVVSV